MQTPTHFLLTAFLNRTLPGHDKAVHTGALLFGAVLPDLPITVLTLVGELYYRWFASLPTDGTVMEYLHFTLFFTDPFWIVSHNFFHSLVINALLLTIGGCGWQRRRRWGFFLFWLAISLLFHTVIDIATHHSDGPLFLFPLNWTYRFASSISYWEADYHGRTFTVFEYTLNALIVAYFGWHWLWSRRRHRR